MPNDVNFAINVGVGQYQTLSENLSRLHQYNSHYPNAEYGNPILSITDSLPGIKPEKLNYIYIQIEIL